MLESRGSSRRIKLMMFTILGRLWSPFNVLLPLVNEKSTLIKAIPKNMGPYDLILIITLFN